LDEASSSSGNIALVLRGVSHVFGVGAAGRRAALQAVDLTLAKGEFFAVVGPSGCGKSTMLDIAAGVLKASEGRSTFDGAPVHGIVPEGSAVVFQEDASFPWLSVWTMSLRLAS